MKFVRIFMKLAICITVIVLLFNCFSAFGLLKNKAQADLLANIADFASNPIAGIGKIIFQGIKLSITYMADGIQSILFALASSGGLNTADTSRQITPFDIFFNRFAIVDVNMFSLETATGDPLPTDSLVYNIRMNTARWYYAFYFIALAALPAILAVVTGFAIKDRVMNDTAEQKKIIRDAVTSWVVGLVLTLIMHIIIILIININNLFIELVAGIMTSNGLNADISDQMESLHTFSYNDNILISVGSLIVYVMMVLQTFKFLLSYLWRFLRVTILVIISPIMPVIYATKDLTNGSTGDIMNTWFKEFIYNVFVQSVDALVYAVLVGVAMSSLSTTTVTGTLADLAPAMMAVAAMMFVKKAEDLIKNILGFDKTKSFSKNSIISNVFGGIRNAAVATAGTALGLGAAQKIGTPFGIDVGKATATSLAAGAAAGTAAASIGNTGSRIREAASNQLDRAKNIAAGNDSQPSLIGDGRESDSMPMGAGDEGGYGGIIGEKPGTANELEAVKEKLKENTRADQQREVDQEEVDKQQSSMLSSEKNNTLATDKKEKEVVTNNEESETNNVTETEIYETVPAENSTGNQNVTGKQNQPPIDAADDKDEELLEEFKDKMAELQEESDQIGEWGDEVDQKLDEIEGLKENLQSGEDRLIEDEIDEKIKEYLETSPELRESSDEMLEKIKAFIEEKFKDDPTKLQYADAYLDFKAFSALDDENSARKAQLIQEYRKKGLRINDDVAVQLMTVIPSDSPQNPLSRMTTTKKAAEMIAMNQKAPHISAQDVGTSSKSSDTTYGTTVITEESSETETIDAPSAETTEDLSSTKVLAEAIKQATQSEEYNNAATKALNVERALEGKVNVSGELSEEDLTELATHIETNIADPKINYKNHIKGFNDAKRKVEAQGSNAMRQCEEFLEDPTPERAAGMSQVQRDFVRIANLVDEKNLIANYEIDGKSYGNNSSAVISTIEQMKARKGTNSRTSSSNVIELPRTNTSNNRKAG